MVKEKLLRQFVCFFFFPLISLKKDQVFSLNEKGVKAVVLGPESSDTKIKDAFEGKYKVRLFGKSVCCEVGFDREFKTVFWTLQNKKRQCAVLLPSLTQ